jgi:hypothetical protein
MKVALLGEIMKIYVGLTFVACVWLAAPAEAQETFGGYECTEDCSGHKAGYEWAEQNSVSSDDACSGNSQSFEEGCKAYVEDPYRGGDENDEGEEIDE